MVATATPTTSTNTTPGLVVAATDPIRSFLSSAAASEDLAADIRDLASALSSEPAISYRSLRAIWCAASPDARPPLRDLLHGTEFVLRSPKPREKVLRFLLPFVVVSRFLRSGESVGSDSDSAAVVAER
ncbi:hypothetical protein PR202_ga07955 [Eleusine coracana subsp. coracana]|uniref:Uncharacterized protein n=1 Tax=Eleusine coracana subsp. coracana TaxID=191504 RepID=A0AAV5C1C6_ELECO|nr:hypothetical protein PR202_ga07955 [Eleusine coracana subsp. coracana]